MTPTWQDGNKRGSARTDFVRPELHKSKPAAHVLLKRSFERMELVYAQTPLGARENQGAVVSPNAIIPKSRLSLQSTCAFATGRAVTCS